MTSTTFVARAHPYIAMDEVADLLNRAAGKNTWDARQARAILGRGGALVKLGERWFTTRRRLRAAFPDLWDELMVDLGDDDAGEPPETSEDIGRRSGAGS
jgi:hypothetical protein